METQEIICRLCLKICESFKALEGTMKNFLDKLLPKINLVAVQKPVVCRNCAEVLKKCFDFKAMCFNACGNIISFVNNEGAVKLDQIDVSLSRNDNGPGIQEDQDICGFCRNPPKHCYAMSIDVEEGDVMLKNIIKQCLSKLDLSINKKPVICTSCYGSVEIYFRFVMNFLTVEEKIKKYCETLDIGSRGQIELSQLLQSSIRHVTSEADGNSVSKINVVEELCEGRKNADDGGIGKERANKLEQMYDDDSEGAKVQVEQGTESYMDMTHLQFNNEQFTPENMFACKEESDSLGVIKTEETTCGENKIKEEDIIEMEDQKFLLHEEIEIKIDDSDFCRFEDDVVSPHPEVATRLLRSLMSNTEENLSESNIKHTVAKKHVSKIRRDLFMDKDPSEVTMYKCSSCSFQTTYKKNLKNHSLVHRNPSEITMYKCDSCSHQTKYKENLKTHSLVHRNPSEITMYKCDSCSYQTKIKYGFTRHLLVHRNPSELTMYKCDSCSFQTKHKSYLKRHFLLHKNPSEMTMYKCDSCSHQTKYKASLKKHSLMHRNPRKVTMHKCDSCSYQTKYQVHLESHMLVHRNPSEGKKYKCDSCSFRTNHKSYLKKHFLRHKNPSEITKYKEVTMYKCYSCSHQTKYKVNLKKHLLVHRNSSEVTLYKCDSCSFQTKYSVSLKIHSLVHKDPSKVIKHKCDSCLFQAKDESCLKKHLLAHKDPSKVTVHKCDCCSFQTKYKSCLKQHLLVHMDPSEVAMYVCASCSFQSKRKGALKKHLLIHKDPSEVKMYQCDFCSHQTKHKTDLKRHIFLVHKEDPYKSLEIIT